MKDCVNGSASGEETAFCLMLPLFEKESITAVQIEHYNPEQIELLGLPLRCLGLVGGACKGVFCMGKYEEKNNLCPQPEVAQSISTQDSTALSFWMYRQSP